MTKEFIETQMDRVGTLWNSEKNPEKKTAVMGRVTVSRKRAR